MNKKIKLSSFLKFINSILDKNEYLEFNKSFDHNTFLTISDKIGFANLDRIISREHHIYIIIKTQERIRKHEIGYYLYIKDYRKKLRDFILNYKDINGLPDE